VDVALIFRSPKKAFFSIEKVYAMVGAELGKKLSFRKVFVPFQRASIADIVRNLLSLRKVRADLYHITGEIYYTSILFPANKLLTTIHDCNYVRNQSGLKGRLIRYFWFDLPVKKSRYLVAISEQTKKEIIELTGCDPDKIFVIPNPLPAGFSYTQKDFNSDSPVILHIGTRWNKNLERVIPALGGLPARLKIIGRLTEKQAELAEKHGIRYESVADLSEEELIRAYVDSDLVLFPSLSEGFGLPIIEAQAIGRPLITSNRPPMSHVAGNGACLVDPESVESIAKAVRKLIDDESYRKELVHNGLQNVAKYRADRIADQYLQVYLKYDK
jgi:glycosyltransferase involved in cell wall biosynthesis